jgi:hypothetical protein
VFLDQLIKQRVLWLMSLVLKWANGPEVVLEYIGWQDRVSQGLGAQLAIQAGSGRRAIGDRKVPTGIQQ